MPVEQTASESVAEAPSTVNKENSKAASADLFNAKPKSTQKSKKIISKCERLFLADQAKLEKLKKQTERNNEQVQKEVSKAEKLAQKEEAKALLPKSPLTAFFCFASRRRVVIKEENPSLSVTEIAKRLGEEWKALEPEARQPYEAESEVD